MNIIFSSPIHSFILGNISLVICFTFYLIWWCVSYKDNHGSINMVKVDILLLPAVVAGIAGGVLILTTANKVEITYFSAQPFFTNFHALIAGAIAYLVLLLTTLLIAHRPISSELAIISAWTAAQFIQINSLYLLGEFSKIQSEVLFILTLLLVSVILVCYLIFFKLPSQVAFIDGAIPLVLAIIYLLLFTVLIFL